MRLSLWVVSLAAFGLLEASATSVPNVIAYYHSTSCDATPNRVDLEFNSDCNSQCLENLDGDWKAWNYICPLGDYKKAVWDAFGGASYILQEAYIGGCDSRAGGACAFLASGKCEQVIMFIKDWDYAVYSIAQLESDGSASVKYFTESDCSTALAEARPLTPYITAQDTTIDKATLNSDSCDGDDYRWSYYSSSSPYTPDTGSASSGSTSKPADDGSSSSKEDSTADSGSGSSTKSTSSDSGTSKGDSKESSAASSTGSTPDEDSSALPTASNSNSSTIDSSIAKKITRIRDASGQASTDGTSTKVAQSSGAFTSGNTLGIIAGAAGALFIVVIVVLGLILYRRRSDKAQKGRLPDGRQSEYALQNTPSSDQQN
ncbi:hypothetical protein PHYSODRAFT_257581 [Phytophthora sojae]|uniref:Uncharacterized protein n=1 Tax=Phytophthora sojae (strain P6497) TaxID=1094619 RepID=G4YFI0_PHYSP|nr:hypothetical protein PHYSODRAFT_257581 [Phytophthora sojae]EGZ26965.1 hypothetical protein PHYSODRAFT_257581 [Phytophthora sojae]|eukprot:XP_009514240.1 hypothetical protein PHYSODRAFT_257581 [Phytophthora sojae]